MSYTAGQPVASRPANAASLIQSVGTLKPRCVAQRLITGGERAIGDRPEQAGSDLPGSNARVRPIRRDRAQAALTDDEREVSDASVQPIERRFDEQDAKVRIGGEQLADEELVAAPDIVPGLERAHHDRVRRRSSRGAVDGDFERMKNES